MFHDIINEPPIHEGYTVTFADQPSFHSLDKCEGKWYHKRDAQITIQSMILPRVKEFHTFYAVCFDLSTAQ